MTTNKLLAFGNAGDRSAAALLSDVLDACAERGIDRGRLRGEAVAGKPRERAAEATIAPLSSQTGRLLAGDAPDMILMLWFPSPPDMTVIEQAWPGSSSYMVAEAVNVDGPATGICRFSIVTRNPTMSRPEFWEYWNGHHAPLVIEHVPLFRRYVNNLVLDDRAPIDGIGQQWFADLDALDEHDRLNVEQKPKIAADLPRFVQRTQQVVADFGASHVETGE